jgi:hypothetical protein
MALEAQHAAAALEHGSALRALRPAFVSGFLDARKPEHLAALGAMREVAERVGAGLGLEIVVPDGAEAAALGDVAQAAGRAGIAPATVAVTLASHLDFVMPGTVFPDTRGFDRLYAAARAAFPGCLLGGGSFVYFTELNRMRPPFDRLDFVCHGTCAIVHMADDRSVAETIESLPYIVQSARALFGDKTYRICPGGIGSRTSPFGNEPTPNPASGRVTMTRADPRQRGLLGAAWHLGYAARMAEGGVDEVGLGAPVGEFGLIHHPMGYAQPWYDEAGGVYPAYHVMRAAYAASGCARVAAESSSPRDLQAVAFRNARGAELWLANLSAHAQAVSIEGAPPGAALLTMLDEARFEACAAGAEAFEAGEARHQDRAVDLAPYAVARLRWMA